MDEAQIKLDEENEKIRQAESQVQTTAIITGTIGQPLLIHSLVE